MPPQDSPSDWTDNRIPYEQRLLLAEEDTRKKISFTISFLESAVEAWKAAGRKPDSIKKTMAGFQLFLEELDKWERESLLSQNSTDLAEREMRLKLFVNICRRYRYLGSEGV